MGIGELLDAWGRFEQGCFRRGQGGNLTYLRTVVAEILSGARGFEIHFRKSCEEAEKAPDRGKVADETVNYSTQINFIPQSLLLLKLQVIARHLKHQTEDSFPLLQFLQQSLKC